jgi:predicted dehydrogenase
MKLGKYKIAIVSLGSIGRRHIRLIKEFYPKVHIVLVRTKNSMSWPEEAMAETVVSCVECAIQEGVDGAIICSPATFHLEHAKPFIDQGITVLIEKPLSNNLDSIKNFINAESDYSKLVILGYVFRHSVAANKIKSLINSDELGQILQVDIECKSNLKDWRPGTDYRQSVSANRELGGGVLLELSHEIDYASWLFGPLEVISAHIESSDFLDVQVEDIVYLRLRGRDNAQLKIYLSFSSKELVRHCCVSTEKGCLNWDLNCEKITWKPVDGNTRVWFCGQSRDDLFKKQHRHFFDVLEQRVEPCVTFDEGVEVLKIINDIWQINENAMQVT